MKFDKEYTEYWTSAVNRSVDGTVIAGANEVDLLLQSFEIINCKNMLDLGCSFGRMFHALSVHSDNIFGVDPDPYAVTRAKEFPYKDVRQGTAEATGFSSSLFDFVFCWAVFDVVDHQSGLLEINRILNKGGKLLFTGKCDSYFEDDDLAFKAEKNAYLKNFPNRFTDVKTLVTNIHKFGFRVEKLLLFPRRGDLGLLNSLEVFDLNMNTCVAYEYLILCNKFSDSSVDTSDGLSLDHKQSKTSIELSRKAGFTCVSDFFLSIGLD